MKQEERPSVPSGTASQQTGSRPRPEVVSRHHSATDRDRDTYSSRQAARPEGNADPVVIDPELIKRDPLAEPGYAEALKAWARFRFVRAGWFTAQEAIDYIE